MTKKEEKEKMKTAYSRFLHKNVIIRGIRYHYIGYLEEITERELVLVNASWLADTGGNEKYTWTDFLDKGPTSNSEIELYSVKGEQGMITINRASIQEASVWIHDLPKNKK
jgi:hypothetical protein